MWRMDLEKRVDVPSAHVKQIVPWHYVKVGFTANLRVNRRRDFDTGRRDFSGFTNVHEEFRQIYISNAPREQFMATTMP